MLDCVVRFGMEFEFMNYKDDSKYDPTIYKLPNNWLHTREYYVGMQEIITNPKRLSKRGFFKNIRSFISTIKQISKDNQCKIPLFSVNTVKYEGIISNGLHIHLSFTKKGKNLLNNFNLPYDLYLAVIDKVYNNNLLGIRSLYSHHIYGYLSESHYDFKTKERFAPIIISPKKDGRKPKTIEIRIFDLETILQPNVLWKVIKEIKNQVLKAIEEKENYRYNPLYRVENILYSPIYQIETNFNNYDNFIYDFGYSQIDILEEILRNMKKKKAYYFENGLLMQNGTLFNNLPKIIKEVI